MGSSWKTIFKKMEETPVDKPRSTDWEAMERMIENDPNLAKPRRSKRYGWLAGGIPLALVLGLVVVLWWPFGQSLPHNAGGSDKTTEQFVTGTDRSIGNRSSQEGLPSEGDHQGLERSSVVDEGSQKIEEKAGGSGADKPSMPKRNENQQLEASEVAGSDDAGAMENRKTILKQKSSQKATEQTSSNEDKAVAEVKSRRSEDGGKPDENPHRTKENFAESSTAIPTVEEELDNKLLNLNRPSLWETLKEGVGKQPSESSLFLGADLAAEEGIDLAEEGFRLSGISAGAAYSAGFESDFFAYGYGADVDIQRGRWIFTTGLSTFNFIFSEPVAKSVQHLGVDTSYRTHIESQERHYVDSIWIIQGPYQGAYAYDTVNYQSFDTVVETQIDTFSTNISYTTNRRVRVSYVEIPTLVGYRFHRNRLAFELSGGAIFAKSTSLSGEDSDLQTTLGIDAAFRPTVRYFLVPRLSVFGRASVRYNLLSDGFGRQKFRYNFQLGVGYHF